MHRVNVQGNYLPGYMIMQSVSVFVHTCPLLCVDVFVWDFGAEAKVKSALTRLSGWMENIRVSRDCSGICRRI